MLTILFHFELQSKDRFTPFSSKLCLLNGWLWFKTSGSLIEDFASSLQIFCKIDGALTGQDLDFSLFS